MKQSVLTEIASGTTNLKTTILECVVCPVIQTDVRKMGNAVTKEATDDAKHNKQMSTKLSKSSMKQCVLTEIIGGATKLKAPEQKIDILATQKGEICGNKVISPSMGSFLDAIKGGSTKLKKPAPKVVRVEPVSIFSEIKKGKQLRRASKRQAVPVVKTSRASIDQGKKSSHKHKNNWLL